VFLVKFDFVSLMVYTDSFACDCDVSYTSRLLYCVCTLQLAIRCCITSGCWMMKRCDIVCCAITCQQRTFDTTTTYTPKYPILQVNKLCSPKPCRMHPAQATLPDSRASSQLAPPDPTNYAQHKNAASATTPLLLSHHLLPMVPSAL
jgi:hypothetical protein